MKNTKNRQLAGLIFFLLIFAFLGIFILFIPEFTWREIIVSEFIVCTIVALLISTFKNLK